MNRWLKILLIYIGILYVGPTLSFGLCEWLWWLNFKLHGYYPEKVGEITAFLTGIAVVLSVLGGIPLACEMTEQKEDK